jgi:NAD(P)-dependent dehydrogenase (short-subunit alcohol dehydrogenase family)
MKLGGKVALVTGASGGIGAAVAVALASEGARVLLQYHRGESAVRKVLARIPGGGHTAIRADLGVPEEAGRLIEGSLSACGRLDLLVNNAGLFESHPPLSTPPAEWLELWNRTLALNLTGAALLSYHAARVMQASGGRIVNISSRGAFRGEPEAPAYGASKAGMNAMSQSFAKALAPQNILVFAVAPGWIDTVMAALSVNGPDGASIAAQSPLNRLGTPEEIAAIVLWLATDAPAFMTGAIIDANGASYLRT